jgi:hypothetical protein
MSIRSRHTSNWQDPVFCPLRFFYGVSNAHSVIYSGFPRATFVLFTRLHVLIQDTQVVLNNCGVILWDPKENKSLSRSDIAVSNSTVNHV